MKATEDVPSRQMHAIVEQTLERSSKAAAACAWSRAHDRPCSCGRRAATCPAKFECHILLCVCCDLSVMGCVALHARRNHIRGIFRFSSFPKPLTIFITLVSSLLHQLLWPSFELARSQLFAHFHVAKVVVSG